MRVWRDKKSVSRAWQERFQSYCLRRVPKRLEIALSAEVSSLWREHYTVGLLLLEGEREQKGNFDTQKVYMKFKRLRVFYWDFLRNWHLYGTLIWESMSFRMTNLLMKLAGPKVSTWSQKNSEKMRKFENF